MVAAQRARAAWVVFLSAVLVLMGCGQASSAAAPRNLTSVSVAMSYFANVQFAPFYVAQTRGYYRDAGLDVHFRYGISSDFLRLTSTGKIDFVNAAGDEVLTAGARGLKVTYVMTQYSRFPAALFALRTTGIRSVRDLRGRTIGIPLPFGANYVGLLALLQRNGIARSSVTIRSIGFQQVESVVHHRVDAAVGYAMNEPIQARVQGYPVTEFDIYHWADLAGAGIAAGNGLIRQRPQVVRGFVRATLRGLADTLRDPAAAYRISAATIRISTNARVERAVLQRAVVFWHPETRRPLGWIDGRIWTTTASLLYQFKQIPRRVPAGNFYTNRFVQGQ